MAHETLATWHRLVASRDTAALPALLADDVVFHSPVVHTPQRGKAATLQYLVAAFQVFFNPSFRYVREIAGERDALLEFEVEMDGVQVNGVDILRWDDQGRIIDFKVLVRPLKGMQAVHARMAAMLQAQQQQ
jgi:hypothetical protein